jgi:hypothetical protein
VARDTETDTLKRHLLAALEAAIEAGWSVAAIARAKGVSQPHLNDFRRHNTRLTTGSASKLIDWFSIKLGPPKIPAPPR